MADYQTFIQKNGPRKGQKYTVKTGKSGLKVRVYESGDTALVNKTSQPISTRGGLGGGVYGAERKRRYNPNAPR